MQSGIVWFLSRIILVLLALFLTLFVIRLFASPGKASAASSEMNPGICLGGWKQPRMAGGEPSNPVGASADAYSQQNSAFLDRGIAAPLFCSGFAADYTDVLPQEFRLRIHWSLSADSNMPPIQDDRVIDESLRGTSYEKPADMEESLVIPALDGVFVPDTAPPAQQESEPEQTPVEPEPSEVVPQPVPEVMPVSDPPEAMFSAPRIARLFVPIAHADSEMPIESDFLIVSYSLDGVSWKELRRFGTVSGDPLDVRVPLSSWGDVQDLQLKIDTLSTANDHPPVYVDGLTLVADFPSTIGSIVGDQVAAVASVADAAIDFVNGLADSTLALFSGEQESVPAVAANTEAPQLPAPPRVEKRLAFSIEGSPLRAHKVLDWYDEPMKKLAASAGSSLQTPDVNISRDGLRMTVSGSCARKYFVVLTFRGETDYNERPQTFASNFADTCVNGRFAYAMDMLPLDTSEGVYYLLLADQNDGEQWIPSSVQIPIRIKHEEIEVTNEK